jgi:Ca2+-transporting ATPase
MAMRPDTELPAWSLSADTVLQELAVDSARGLEEDEALRRRRVFGRNQLQVAQQRHLMSILVDQFKMLFSDIAEAVAILIVIVINTTIGFLTEWRAIRSMEALRRYAQVTCVLLRGGRVKHAASEELVPGDIVFLEAGDLVPADLRLVQAQKLNANESTLTGESLPVHSTRVRPLREGRVAVLWWQQVCGPNSVRSLSRLARPRHNKRHSRND